MLKSKDFECVKIGDQIWTTKNLDVNRFRNGDLIPHLEFDEEWIVAEKKGQPAWCYYDNDPRGLAPEGWHIPTDKEWTILKKFLDISTGGWKLKSVEGWNKWKDEYGKFQNGNGDNSSGFNALPGGFRDDDGTGIDVAIFWSATEIKTSKAWTLSLTNDTGFLDKTWAFKQEGLSVRCIKNSRASKRVQHVIL